MITDTELIKRGNLKLTCFEVFDFSELRKIADWMESQGYAVFWVDNGNIVFQKIVPQPEIGQYKKMDKGE